MKASVYTAPGKMEIQERELGLLKDSFVRIKVRACGICGSDVHGYHGTTGRRIPPLVMGHEFAGDVVAVGKDVATVMPGERVAVYPLMYCSVCTPCKQGLTNICTDGRVIGTFTRDGAMAEYVDVGEQYIVKLPDDLPYTYAAMAEPCAVAFRAVKRAGELKGKSVLVVGAGPIGLFIVLMALRQEPAVVLVSELNPDRIALAREFGAKTFDPQAESVTDALLRLTGEKQADVSFEAVGATPTVQQAIHSTKNGGVSVWVGNTEKIVGTPMQEIVTREIQVIGSHIYTREEFASVIHTLVESGTIHYMRKLLSKTIPLEETPATFEELSKPGNKLLKVLIVSDNR